MSLIVAFVFLPYLLGSIPFGLIVTRLAGHGDIRKIGSGNIGATNVMRTGSRKLAALTLLLDGLKGFLALFIPGFFIHMPDLLSLYYVSDIRINFVFAAALCALLGHIFPVWLRFKGGKGVATAIGTLFFLHPLLAVNTLLFWLVTFYCYRISSLSALCAFFLTTVVTLFVNFADPVYAQNVSGCVAVITLVIFYTHRQNLSRLLKGEEHSWRKP